MGRSFGLLSLLIVAGIGGYIYMNQTRSLTAVGSSPNAAIDTVAVRNDLMALANAERRYWVSNSKYAALDELARNGDIHIPSRANFAYSAQANENGFTVTATYSGPDPKVAKRMSVDETLVLKTD